MRFYLSFAVLLSMSQAPVRSQELGPCGGFFQSVPCSLSALGQSMQGTWVTQISDTSGNSNVSQMGSFSADGSYSGTNVSPLQSTHRGLWLRTGDRTFALTTMFFTHDAQGRVQWLCKGLTLVPL